MDINTSPTFHTALVLFSQCCETPVFIPHRRCWRTEEAKSFIFNAKMRRQKASSQRCHLCFSLCHRLWDTGWLDGFEPGCGASVVPISGPSWDYSNQGLEVKEAKGSQKEIPESVRITALASAVEAVTGVWRTCWFCIERQECCRSYF